MKARRPQGEGEGEGSSGKSFMKGGRYGDADGIVTVRSFPESLELGTAPLIEKRADQNTGILPPNAEKL